MESLRSPFEDLAGRTAVITGAARGIGLEIARSLREVGMAVLLVDRDAAELDAAVAHLQDQPGDQEVRGIVAELAAGDLQPLARALDRLPELTTWVNNAGMVSHQTALKTDPATFEQVFSNNVVSALRGSQLAMTRMQDGAAPSRSIVNITSLVIDKVLPERLSYATSKAALTNVVHYTAQEWGRAGVRVNAVCPGYIDSRLTQWSADDPRSIAKEQTVEIIALRRLGTADDVARTVLYLASPLASYVTGQVIYLDGGWHLV